MIGVVLVLWVIMIPVVIYTRQPIYLSILLDGVAVIVYLYLLTYLTGHNSWFYGLGLPIVLLVTAVVEAVMFCIRKLPMSFLTGALYLISGIAVLCVGLELLIDRFLRQEIALGWSAIVLTICGSSISPSPPFYPGGDCAMQCAEDCTFDHYSEP